jgi:hypothetical protein
MHSHCSPSVWRWLHQLLWKQLMPSLFKWLCLCTHKQCLCSVPRRVPALLTTRHDLLDNLHPLLRYLLPQQRSQRLGCKHMRTLLWRLIKLAAMQWPLRWWSSEPRTADVVHRFLLPYIRKLQEHLRRLPDTKYLSSKLFWLWSDHLKRCQQWLQPVPARDHKIDSSELPAMHRWMQSLCCHQRRHSLHQMQWWILP